MIKLYRALWGFFLIYGEFGVFVRNVITVGFFGRRTYSYDSSMGNCIVLSYFIRIYLFFLIFANNIANNFYHIFLIFQYLSPIY